MSITIDILDLTKGSVISTELVEQMTGQKYGTPHYDLAVMVLAQEIDQHLRRKDIIVTICSVKGAIHILTDEAAALYNVRQSELAVNKLSRAYGRNRAVERKNLGEIDRRVHVRNVDLQGRMLTEVRRVRREFFIEEHQRKTPGLN